MNISLNTLKEFVSLANISPEEVGQRLNAHTVEVEKIIKSSDRFKNVVVAKILEIEKHPQADKLQIALVDVGEKDPIRVVCGATNIAVGQLVPLAKVGAVLENGLEIKEAEIRGEKSNGMLCAEDELGLGENHDGIMILEEKAKIGEGLAKYLDLDDIIFEIDNKSLSNRPDLWGHYGLAREVSVLFSKKLKDPEPKDIKIKKVKKDKPLENILVDIKAKNLCPKYLALKIEGIKVEESPQWLKNKLSSLEIGSVNNIVDATNYIMIELGQPLHAFDGDKINKIIVRRAEKNEKINTLDNEEKILNEDDLLICSEKEAIAIAGVMGGKNSQINNTSSSIIIESANFDAVSVRKTAQRLGLRSDAAMRFEKGLDANLCKIAIKRVAEVIKKLCPKAVFSYEIVEQGDFKNEEQKISLDLNWVEKLIGHKIEDKKIESILENLGFVIKKENDNLWEVLVPSWRQKDVKIKEDLLEEIARIYGYNNIPTSLPLSKIIPPEKDPIIELSNKIKNILSCSYKMSEAYNYSFVSEEQLTKLDIDSKSYLKLLNPLSKQHNLLRQTLSTNLINNIKVNQAKYDRIAMFEVGNIFLNIAGGPSKDDKLSESLPYQEKKLGLILANKRDNVFSDLKNIIFNLLCELSNGREAEFIDSETIINWADKKEKCLILLGGKELGFLAKVDKNILNKNGLKTEIACIEIDLKILNLILNKVTFNKYQGIAKFPEVNRDLAFVIDEKIPYNDISREIKDFDNLIQGVELFDVYSGKNLEGGKKSMAFHLKYRSSERTLSGEEVESIVQKLIKHLEEKFGAQIRNF